MLFNTKTYEYVSDRDVEAIWPEFARFVVDSSVVVAVPVPNTSFGVQTAAAPTAWTDPVFVGIGHQLPQRVDAVVHPEQAQSQALVLALQFEEARVQEYFGHQGQVVDRTHPATTRCTFVPTCRPFLYKTNFLVEVVSGWP